MASLTERRDKSGKLISFGIRVHRGRGADGKQLAPATATFKVSPTWTEKSARKKAEAFAATFEKEIREGVRTDSRLKFQPYCEYVIDLKQQRGLKHSTVVRYKELAERIYPQIGHLKLNEIRADHLNDLLSYLSKEGARLDGQTATPAVDFRGLLKERKISQSALAKKAGIAASTLSQACKGESVTTVTAQKIADALEMPMEKLFAGAKCGGRLSNKTVLEHHRLVSTVLEQALKEGLVPFNVADRAQLPKVEKKEVSYFQPEQIQAIREALEMEPLKWKTLTHLLLITGARRGEILGLKWAKVDFEKNRIHICNSILYSADVGVYEDSPKTAASIRYVTLPPETMLLLRQYKLWQTADRLKKGEYYHDNDLLFTAEDGTPMNPDSVTDWLGKFSSRHQLPHIHPHAFRHTMASMLYFNGVDSVSISKRLGHAQVSTTANIYAHVVEEADQRNADILEDIFLKSKKKLG